MLTRKGRYEAGSFVPYYVDNSNCVGWYCLGNSGIY